MTDIVERLRKHASEVRSIPGCDPVPELEEAADTIEQLRKQTGIEKLRHDNEVLQQCLKQMQDAALNLVAEVRKKSEQIEALRGPASG